MYVGDRDTYNDVFCQECGNIADRETLNDNGICEYCVEKITIRTELSIENAVKLYNALNPVGQRNFFGNLENADARHLQTAIRADHADRDYNCSCFACIVWIE